MSVRSGAHEQSKQGGANKRVSGASEQANGRASGPVLQFVFLVILNHSGEVEKAQSRSRPKGKRQRVEKKMEIKRRRKGGYKTGITEEEERRISE